MESSKHSLQDHHLLLLSSSSSSSSPTSSCTTLLHDSSSSYAPIIPIAGGSPHLFWTQNIFLNSTAGNGLSSSYVNNQSLQNHQVHFVSSSLDSTMTPHQDLSFQWANGTNINTNIINPHQDLQQFSHSHNIKKELSYSKKFSELISSSPSSSSTIEDHHHHQQQLCSNSSHHRATTNFFSQIYPTINISSSSSSSSSNSSTTTYDMNLQALDLFHYSARSLMQDQLDISSSRRNGGGSLSYNALHHDDHQYMQRPFTSTNMTVQPFSSNGGGVAAGDTKRSDEDVLLLETKATHEAEVAPAPANKRSRLESRASCTPFKVRKEKLGDRIAALQQLVAPFGKTDTASVLMEAIGYIKFLQNQVETLSVPYLKSSRNKTHQRPVQGGTILNEERKRDLRSRGLCLVPLSCLSYMTDSGGAVWPPPNFGGGT